ncbi:hypothetical protein L7F22_063085 [Adiantum nelumboides]|nr:hypothetical protein [Adiantum nelumboides]
MNGAHDTQGVTYDIPRELPPKLGDDDHAIELLPRSSSPNKPPLRVSQAQQENIMRWVYKKKHIADDPQPKYKGRLVAKQKKRVDFDENFSLVVKMTTLHLLLGLVAIEDMELIQMDVKTTFLPGDLEENIYMVQPEGFEIKPEKPTRAELAKKSAENICNAVAKANDVNACVYGVDCRFNHDLEAFLAQNIALQERGPVCLQFDMQVAIF